MTISTVEELCEHLQWSVEIEHGTLPPYLCALYSIREGCNVEAAEVIHSVFIEEMLHLTLAANLLNAVGGAPVLDSPALLPAYPAFLPHSNRAFELSLQKFSPQAVELFMAIEKPGTHDSLPEDEAYESIGQFYDAIGEALERLSVELGERALFCGDPGRQVSDTLYYGGSGRIIAVTDLNSARRALAEIVEQGEGIDHQAVWDGDRGMFHPDRDEVAHYFRFSEIAHGRRYAKGDTPQSGPTGETFSVDWGAVHNMRTNPRSRDYADGSEIRMTMDEFNRSYCSVLHLLHVCFNGSPGLLAPATGAMYALKQQAIDLMSLPSNDGATTVGPSFEYLPPGERHHVQHGKIVVLPNGPYLVSGNVPLVRKRKLVSENRDALTWQKTAVLETEETYALCRCGRSGSKPFCDGTHARVGFDGTETADPRDTEERQVVLDGDGIVVRRDGSLCMHAAFCVGAARKIPAMMADTADSDVRAHVMSVSVRVLHVRRRSGQRGHRARPTGRDRGHHRRERTRRRAVGDRRHPNHPFRRSAPTDPQPRHPVPVRTLAHKAALRRHASRDPFHRNPSGRPRTAIATSDPESETARVGDAAGHGPEPAAAIPDQPDPAPRAADLTGDDRLTGPVELVWDLVFVFAVTQVTTLLSQHLSWTGFAHSMLVLALVWWAWSAFVWAANAHDPESTTLRAALLFALLLIFIVGLTVPHAFGSDATLFAATYAAVRFVHLALYADASRRGNASWSSIAGFAVTVTVGMALLIVGSLLHGSLRLTLWIAAAAIDYAGPAWLTRERLRGIQQVAVAHFAERYGLFVIICLGESIVEIGLGANGQPIDGHLVVVAAFGVLITIGMWWTYFDRFAATAEELLRDHHDPVLAAADGYSYIHLLLVAGIILFAVGMRLATHHVNAPLGGAPRLALCGGVALYLAGHAVFRLRMVGSLSYEKVAASGIVLAVYAVAGGLPAWALAATVAAVLTILCARETRNDAHAPRLLGEQHQQHADASRLT